MRSVTSAVNTAFNSDHVPLLVLCELDFASGIVRVTNATYNFVWNTQTFTGLGQLGRIDVIEEGEDMVKRGLSLSLSGVPTSLVNTSLNEDYQGRRCTLWIAPLSSTYAILADPAIVFEGRMDVMSVVLGDTAEISVTVENELIAMDVAPGGRYTQEDQLSKFPGDNFFQYVPMMQSRTLNWGIPNQVVRDETPLGRAISLGPPGGRQPQYQYGYSQEFNQWYRFLSSGALAQGLPQFDASGRQTSGVHAEWIRDIGGGRGTQIIGSPTPTSSNNQTIR